MAEGWLYVAAVIDLFSRRLVGWSMTATMAAQLVKDALMTAAWRRGKPDALLHLRIREANTAVSSYLRRRHSTIGYLGLWSSSGSKRQLTLRVQQTGSSSGTDLTSWRSRMPVGSRPEAPQPVVGSTGT